MHVIHCYSLQYPFFPDYSKISELWAVAMGCSFALSLNNGH